MIWNEKDNTYLEEVLQVLFNVEDENHHVICSIISLRQSTFALAFPCTCHMPLTDFQVTTLPPCPGVTPTPSVPIPLASFKHDKLRNKELGKRDSTGWRGQLKGQIQSVSHLGISLFFSRIPESIISLIEPKVSQLWVIFSLQGTFGNVCRHFWLSQHGGGGEGAGVLVPCGWRQGMLLNTLQNTEPPPHLGTWVAQ